MSNYPGAIDEFRTVQNLPGILYESTDTTTVFAEDTNSHSDAISAIESTLGINPQGDYDTVADRLDASGGGGGAWEFVTELVASGSNTELNLTGLDLQGDNAYLVFFSAQCNSAETYIDVYGTSILTESWSGLRVDTGTVTGITTKSFISHRSLGPGVGSMLLQTTPNGSVIADLSYYIGNARMVRASFIDSNWYFGGANLTRILLRTNPVDALVAGSKLTLYKRKK